VTPTGQVLSHVPAFFFASHLAEDRAAEQDGEKKGSVDKCNRLCKLNYRLHGTKLENLCLLHSRTGRQNKYLNLNSFFVFDSLRGDFSTILKNQIGFRWDRLIAK